VDLVCLSITRPANFTPAISVWTIYYDEMSSNAIKPPFILFKRRTDFGPDSNIRKVIVSYESFKLLYIYI
jgi:hypothetical protein